VRFAGIDSSKDFAQASADGTTVFFQAGWAAVADKARLVEDYTEQHSTSYHRHVGLGVIKLIHELFHCMTPKILQLDYELQVLRKVSEPVRLSVTPEKIGFKYATAANGKTKPSGDMGFEAEKLLSGLGRYYAEFGVGWEIDGIVMHKVSSKNKKRRNVGVDYTISGPLSIHNADALIKQMAVGLVASFDDFKVTVKTQQKVAGEEVADERGFLKSASAVTSQAECSGEDGSEVDEEEDGSEVDEMLLWTRAGMVEGFHPYSNKT
jgi:hypothetical protein